MKPSEDDKHSDMHSRLDRIGYFVDERLLRRVRERFGERRPSDHELRHAMEQINVAETLGRSFP